MAVNGAKRSQQELVIHVNGKCSRFKD